MHSREILSQAYPCRIKAVEALIEAMQPRSHNAERLRQIAGELDQVSTFDGRASSVLVYSAFAELLRTLAMLVQWRAAILAAEADADRFLKAALARHRPWEAEYGVSASTNQLRQAAGAITQIHEVQEIAQLCGVIARTPLPVVFAVRERPRIPAGPDDAPEERAEPPELAVAFLSFLIDQRPANEIDFLTPGVVHDLELHVRVSRWPQAAQSLRLQPVTIELASTYELPVFEFVRPAGEPPFYLKRRDRAILKMAQSLSAHPFEFKYAAAFKPDQAEQPIAVVGHRTLRLEGIDFKQHLLTGFPGIDRKVLEIRNLLRAQSPPVGTDELEHAITVLAVLGNLAGRTLRDALFKAVGSEAQFQAEIRDDLRRAPRIGTELEEHPHVGGGIADLSFHGIRIELKFEPAESVTLESCERFMAQTAAYVIATGKRIGILCVLDNSPKASHGMPAEEYIGILSRPTKEGAVHIVTVILQGNFPVPSRM
jgi:hypothetical protein